MRSAKHASARPPRRAGRSARRNAIIEGFTVPLQEAAAIVAGEAQPDPDDENRMAVACYARAMDHGGTMAVDPALRSSERVILDLHFDGLLLPARPLPRPKDGAVEQAGERVDRRVALEFGLMSLALADVAPRVAVAEPARRSVRRGRTR